MVELLLLHGADCTRLNKSRILPEDMFTVECLKLSAMNELHKKLIKQEIKRKEDLKLLFLNAKKNKVCHSSVNTLAFLSCRKIYRNFKQKDIKGMKSLPPNLYHILYPED